MLTACAHTCLIDIAPSTGSMSEYALGHDKGKRHQRENAVFQIKYCGLL
jgi:hypothetical protein